MDLVRPVSIDTTTLASSNVTESESAWSSGTTYALGAAVYRVIDGIHERFTSLQNSNLNHIPEDSPTWWLDEGPTNKWAMFDASVSTQTTRADNIAVTVNVPATERIDVVYLAGLTGVSVRIQITDAIAGAVYDQTFSLADSAGIGDWYSYFMDEPVYLTELLVTDLPNGAGSVLTVTVTNTGSTAACGALVTGFRKSMGGAQWGWTTEIRDYSVFQEDAFGNRVLVPRAYRRLANGRAIIDNRLKDAIETLLADCRASVRLYIIDEDYRSLVILGTSRWSVDMSMPPNMSLCSLQLESVV